MAVNERTVLPCGRTLDDLWDHLDERPDAHRRGCSHCQQARDCARQVTAVSAAMIEHDESDPDMQIGVSVRAAVLEVVGTEVRRSRVIPLERPRPGETTPGLTVSELVVSDVTRVVADALPGLRVRHCHVEYLDQPPQPAEGRPARVGLTVSAAVSAATRLPTLLPELRVRIRDVIAEEIGLDVGAINITVEDLYDA